MNFEDPASVRKLARIISLAIFMGALSFGLVIRMLPPDTSQATPPTENALYMPFVIISAALVLLATFIGTRMHTFRGTLGQRTQRTFTAHVVSLALCEGAALLGLVFVLLTKSWDGILPAALGFAGMLACIIRGEVRFNALVDEKSALSQ
jgi:hypothetical protein